MLTVKRQTPMPASQEQQALDAHCCLLKSLHSVSEEQDKTYMDSWQHEEAQNSIRLFMHHLKSCNQFWQLRVRGCNLRFFVEKTKRIAVHGIRSPGLEHLQCHKLQYEQVQAANAAQGAQDCMTAFKMYFNNQNRRIEATTSWYTVWAANTTQNHPCQADQHHGTKVKL